ncbi:MAG: hypothetical protein WBA57_27585 [Elainellaceae cyanobacterium]
MKHPSDADLNLDPDIQRALDDLLAEWQQELERLETDDSPIDIEPPEDS